MKRLRNKQNKEPTMKQLMNKTQSRQLDEQAGSYALSGEALMENAGKKAAKWILRQFPAPCSFAIFCGPGHNGGDGYVTAYYLKKAGRKVKIFSCESRNKLFNIKKKKAQSLNIPIKNYNSWKAEKNQILIEALFGIGLDRPLKGEFKKLILKINCAQNPIVSLDVPSGLCADTGCILGAGIQADYTLTFALAKPGFYLNEGPKHCSKIIVFPIGFPKKLLNRICCSLSLIEKKEAGGWLPAYKDSANKSHRGWSLIAAGRKGMWGCGLLAVRSASTVGSGYVTWASQDYPYKKSLEIPEALLALLSDKDLFNKKTAVGAGPGLGFSKEAQKLISRLKKSELPVVLDADALTLLAQKKPEKLNQNFLLTPHTGELSRLIKISSQKIEKDRVKYAQLGAKQYNCWLLLKGFYPLLSDGKHSWIIPSGNSALGKAGTGDVLTGIITGLMTQGLPVFQAGVLGVVLQGESAERWLKKGKDINSFSASEIIKELPFVMKGMRYLN